jgi:hypothetical protein
MAGDDWKKREACKMAAWIKPKMGHKQMVQRLLQVKNNLILCFRAEEKVKIEKDATGKTVIVPQGWQPICSKELPYELTVSFLMSPEKPGYPIPLKLQEQHKAIFPLTQAISEESGKMISEWAAGGKAKPAADSFDAQVEYDNLIAHLRSTLADCKDVDDLKKWKEEFLTVKDKLTEQDRATLKRVLMDSAEAMKKA